MPEQPHELHPVWLVGGGPGDPELLTRKAERLIYTADIVFYDALIGPDILSLIAPTAERVSVGKRSGRHSKDQESINDLLLASAKSGRRVVRLKGGDPSIFGRSMEEIAHLRTAGIDVRICPGITAASAAAASLGLSLTLRGMARRLQFVTAHARKGEVLDLDWQALADPESTLAVYMGKAAAEDVSRQLMAAGLSGETPAIVIENASLPEERHLATRLDLLPLAVRTGIGDGPALLLIGKAMDIRAATAAAVQAHVDVRGD
ncbi:uroporphyrinogen-III C-methyltransferase [Rhizorhapis suberifaciens]|uniref:uroporphyrinogen-III C-methyltransferase n=1 Tax=Rhizorhapis suberifaciens TaxID=13656 RepID=A0A840HTR4_9SPHN|nr:uroporphyrinogen-III C-methyltransferase [Rhizorhapis suberifaciens]MBB4640896.1 uroporphyrin-III C-methyltransferase [Rhizorhapis suberifaciens]